MIKRTVQLENSLLFIGSVYLYFNNKYSVLLFFICYFVPDISILFYQFGPKTGQKFYNALHNYVFPIIIAGVNMWFVHSEWLYMIALIWVAHIAMDRMLGYGLKYDTFKHTHIQNL